MQYWKKKRTKKKKSKQATSQRERQKWLKGTHTLWSKLVRHRDGYVCQWCGSNNLPQAHHIVARGITGACKMSWFDVLNGVTLCFDCHINKIKSLPDEYVKWRDEWLLNKYSYLIYTDKIYEELRLRYSVVSKLPLDELIIIYADLKRQCQEKGIEV